MQRAEGGPAFNTRAAKVDAGRPVTPDSEITENNLAIMATDKPLRPQQFSGSQDRVCFVSNCSSRNNSWCYITR